MLHNYYVKVIRILCNDNTVKRVAPFIKVRHQPRIARQSRNPSCFLPLLFPCESSKIAENIGRHNGFSQSFMGVRSRVSVYNLKSK